MKKILFVVFFTLISSGFINAQQFFFGPKVGGNLSHIMYEGDNSDLFDAKRMMLSSHIGFFVEMQLNDDFSIQPELLYSIKGSRFSATSEKDFKSAYVYKYLSLPIIAKYYINEKVSLEVGPQVALLLSAKDIEDNSEYSTNYGEETASVDIKENSKIYDLGVVAGVGYLFDTGFYISARYNLGLANIYESEADTTNYLKNGSVQLSVGFTLQ